MNKFEQVSSDGHQMLLIRKGSRCTEKSGGGGGFLHSEVPRRGDGWRGGCLALYSEVQCIMGNGHMPPLVQLPTDRRLKTLLSRNFVGGRQKLRCCCYV